MFGNDLRHWSMFPRNVFSCRIWLRAAVKCYLKASHPIKSTMDVLTFCHQGLIASNYLSCGCIVQPPTVIEPDALLLQSSCNVQWRENRWFLFQTTGIVNPPICVNSASCNSQAMVVCSNWFCHGRLGWVTNALNYLPTGHRNKGYIAQTCEILIRVSLLRW